VSSGVIALAASVARARCERGSRSLQCAVDRRDAGVEELPDFTGLPAQDFAQDQHGPLPGWQVLQGRNERQLDRLVGHGHVGGIGLAGKRAVQDRLDPGDLRARVQTGLDRFPRGTEVHGQSATIPALQHVEADVGGNPEQPGTQRGAALEVVEPTPSAEHGLLHRVLRLKRRAEHAVAVPGQRLPLFLELLLELPGRGSERGLLHAVILRQPSRPPGLRPPGLRRSATVRATLWCRRWPAVDPDARGSSPEPTRLRVHGARGARRPSRRPRQ
jgi:hypothetical protein